MNLKKLSEYEYFTGSGRNLPLEFQSMYWVFCSILTLKLFSFTEIDVEDMLAHNNVEMQIVTW